MEEEIVIASSSITVHGIGCRDLHTGTVHLRYKSCASPPRGIISVGSRFLDSSHLQDPKASSDSILYWSWSLIYVHELFDKIHLSMFNVIYISFLLASSGVKCIPEKPIKSLDGAGLSGNIYFWEVKPIRFLYDL